MSTAGGYPNNRGFGNLGRNVLRGSSQQRIDLGLSKNTRVTEEVARVPHGCVQRFQQRQFCIPNNVIGEAGTDFDKITDTMGGPRVMQFGIRLVF